VDTFVLGRPSPRVPWTVAGVWSAESAIWAWPLSNSDVVEDTGDVWAVVLVLLDSVEGKSVSATGTAGLVWALRPKRFVSEVVDCGLETEEVGTWENRPNADPGAGAAVSL
jgi:hypothetical protein